MEQFMKRQYDQKEIYYVYAHYKPGTDEIFYVGKGKGGRAYCGDRENNFWKKVVKKNNGFDVKLLLENLKEYEALCMEPMYINAYGRRNQNKGPLVNLTDGGEGVSGMIHSESSKEKNRLAHLGNTNAKGERTAEQKANIGRSKIGNKNMLNKHHTEETKQIIRDKNTGRVASEETKALLSSLLMGNTRALGYKQSQETIQKRIPKLIGNKSRTGQTTTEETKAKQRAAHAIRIKWNKGNKNVNMWISSKTTHEIKLRRVGDKVPDGWVVGRLSRRGVPSRKKGTVVSAQSKEKNRLAHYKKSIFLWKVCRHDIITIFDNMHDAASFVGLSPNVVKSRTLRDCTIDGIKIEKYLK